MLYAAGTRRGSTRGGAALTTTAFNEATALDRGAAAEAARSYAARNGGTVRDISFSGLAVEVEVVTHDALSGQGLESAAGARGTARARAEVEVDYAFGAPAAAAGSGALDPDEIAAIADAAGVPVPGYSSLRNPANYGTGYGGPSINLLAPQMKASIARLETLMGLRW